MTILAKRIYLDHNASAPLLPEARAALMVALDHPGNPSSVHSEGRSTRSLLEKARGQVGALAGVNADRVVFTSGATEAAATCLTPDWVAAGRSERFERLAVLDTDHPCIRGGGRFGEGAVHRLPVDRHGIADLDALTRWLSAGGPGVLALTVANSETGVLQPVAEIVALAKGAGAIVILDAVQMAGRMPIDAGSWGADAVILSGHKIGAPMGVGAFVLGSADRRPVALLIGGAQEMRQRGGTEAVPLIAGFGAAAEVARTRLSGGDGLLDLRRRLEAGLDTVGGACRRVCAGSERLPQTVALQTPHLRAETLQIAMDLEGIAVSAGSACSSGKVGASHVLAALARGGADVDPSIGAIRVSFGHETSSADIEAFLDVLGRQIRRTGAKRAA